MLDSTRLLLALQQSTEVAQRFSGCLQPEDVACSATEGLVHQFGCAFARIWLVESDQRFLRLVASSGLYTRTDGSFARIPMGAYKVGKIAQNRVSFLSNTLADESWVKDREWAIANRICGFAGFPLMVGDRVIGVLAAFSREALSPEFLEVLKVLCTIVSVSIDQAIACQRLLTSSAPTPTEGLERLPALSDQLASILGTAHLTLMGTEHPLTLAQTSLFLQVAEHLNQLNCRYCRLVYTDEAVSLEALATMFTESHPRVGRSLGGLLPWWANSLGGQLLYDMRTDALQVLLTIPYRSPTLSPKQLQVQCRSPVLQVAFTQLAYAAGIQVSEYLAPDLPLLTDDLSLLPSPSPVIWVQSNRLPIPEGVSAVVDLSTDATQLRTVLEAIAQGRTEELIPAHESTSVLSPREQEILQLLCDGLRDRDIAQKLIISESTVKFHVNNVLIKLKAKTRFQAPI
ncbi:MAG: GAF domain-containing protein [Synechococcales cyanobacterium T60_A2020_003]|nr:GAF domain-containing protein [Synechococcales cyanobacterium T60_A2020_003]